MNRNKLRDMQKSDIRERIRLAKTHDIHLIVARRGLSSKSLFIKKLIDEHGYLRTSIFWISEFDEIGNRSEIVGTLGELSNRKYHSNSRYTLHSYKHETIAENVTVLELILTMQKLIEIEP